MADTNAESLYPGDWFRIAAQDLERVAKRLAEGDTEDAAFRLQQAIEKSLKGFLLLHGWKLKRTHDLGALLTDAVRYDRHLERFRGLCRTVSSYYLVQRYPLFEESPPTDEVRASYAKAKMFARALTRRSVRHRK